MVLPDLVPAHWALRPAPAAILAAVLGLIAAVLGLTRIGQVSIWLLASVLAVAVLAGFAVYHRGIKAHPRFETLLSLYGGTWLLAMSLSTLLSQRPRL